MRTHDDSDTSYLRLFTRSSPYTRVSVAISVSVDEYINYVLTCVSGASASVTADKILGPARWFLDPPVISSLNESATQGVSRL